MTFLSSFTNYKKIEIESDDIIKKKIDKRIKKLLELSIEDELNQYNVLISKNQLLSFLEHIEFYEYPKGIGLDDNGYFTLEIDRNNTYAVFIFRDEMHFYYYKDKKLELSLKIQNAEDFFIDINYTKYNELFKYKYKWIPVNYIIDINYYSTFKKKKLIHKCSRNYLKKLEDKDISLYKRINTENVYAYSATYRK